MRGIRKIECRPDRLWTQSESEKASLAPDCRSLTIQSDRVSQDSSSPEAAPEDVPHQRILLPHGVPDLLEHRLSGRES